MKAEIPKKRNKRGPKPGSHVSPHTEIKPGQVLNPHGAPRKGMSIAETIRTVQALTPSELLMVFKAGGGTGKSGLEQSLAAMPQGVPMRILMHASAVIQTTCEPQPGVLNYLADREEGKVTEKHEIGGPNGGAVPIAVYEFRDTTKKLE